MVWIFKRVPYYKNGRMNNDSKHTQEEDAAEWFKAKQTDTELAYQAYLATFPQGLFVESAQQALQQLSLAKEDSLWEHALLEEMPSAFQQYLSAYPQGRYAEMASERLKQLTEIGKEEQAWAKSRQEGSLAAVEQFLHKFPDSEYAPEAKALEDNLRQTEDDRLWKITTQTDTLEAYEAYLRDAPKRTYQTAANTAITVRKRIKQLNRQWQVAPIPEKEMLLQQAAALMAQYPDDFAAYDFHTLLQERYQKEASSPKAEPTTESATIPGSPAKKIPYGLIGMLAFILLILLLLGSVL